MDDHSSEPPLPELTGEQETPLQLAAKKCRVRKRDVLYDVARIFMGQGISALCAASVVGENNSQGSFAFLAWIGSAYFFSTLVIYVLLGRKEQPACTRMRRLIQDAIVVESLTFFSLPLVFTKFGRPMTGVAFLSSLGTAMLIRLTATFFALGIIEISITRDKDKS